MTPNVERRPAQIPCEVFLTLRVENAGFLPVR